MSDRPVLTGDAAVEFLANRAIVLSNTLDTLIEICHEQPAVIAAACKLNAAMYEKLLLRMGGAAQILAYHQVWEKLERDSTLLIDEGLKQNGIPQNGQG